MTNDEKGQLEQARRYRRAVFEMRMFQKAYFKTGDERALQMAQKWESIVDDCNAGASLSDQLLLVPKSGDVKQGDFLLPESK